MKVEGQPGALQVGPRQYCVCVCVVHVCVRVRVCTWVIEIITQEMGILLLLYL